MAGISGTFAWWTEGKMSGVAAADGIDFLTDNVAVVLYPAAPTNDVDDSILEDGTVDDIAALNSATGNGAVFDGTHSQLLATKTVGTIPYTFDAAHTTMALAGAQAQTKNLIITIQAGAEGTVATTDLLIAHIELGAGNYITPNDLDIVIQWDDLGIVKIGANAA